MKNISKVSTFIVLIAVIGFVVVACDENADYHTHNYNEWEQKEPATCITAEVEKRTCSCGNEETRNSKTNIALGHIGLTGLKAATCILAGSTGKGTCTRCNKDIESTDIPAIGHDGGWTTYTNGIRECQRSDCSEIVGIGDTGPAGGIIFYVDVEGFTITGTDSFTAYYLEAAPVNQGISLRWSTATESPYATIDAETNTKVIGTGRNNTALILAGDPTAPAALACKNYTGGGKTDWFLPSTDELDEMYDTRAKLNISVGFFWSSTQYDSTRALGRGFSYGIQNRDKKGSPLSVRAVRAF